MDENSIKFRTIQNKFRFEYRFGDDDVFFEWKTARLDLQQIPRVPKPHNL